MTSRLRTPTILQMETTECGAAALGMVLAYYGRWVPLEELRVACGVSRDGSRASYLVKAARGYGLDAKGVRLEPDKLAELTLPAILYWSFDHFVVLEAVTAKGLRINDPARGPRLASWDEADRCFTGVALDVRADGRVRSGRVAAVGRRGLAGRLRGAGSPLVLCVLAGLGLLVPGLLVPAAVQIFVNQYLGAGNRSWLWPIVVGIAAAAVVSLALTWLQQITLLRLAVKLSISMSVRFFEHVLRLPLAFFGQRYAGHVVTRVGLNDAVASVLSSQLAATLLALVTSLFYLSLMALYDWQLTLVTVAFSAATLAALQAVARRQSDLGRLLVQDTGMLTATAAAGLENIETIKATSSESAFFARWAGQQADVVGEMQELGSQTAVLATLPVLTVGLNTAAVLGFGGWQVMDGSLSIGALAAFQVLVAGFTAPIGQLVGFGQTLQQTAGSLAALDDVLHHPEWREPAPRNGLPPRGAAAAAGPARSSSSRSRSATTRSSRRSSTGSRSSSSRGTASRSSAQPAAASRPWRGSSPGCSSRGAARSSSTASRATRSPAASSRRRSRSSTRTSACSRRRSART